MLVIARKPGERICLGDDITITILEINGSSVRLGLEAPAEVQIYRHEIWLAIKAENQAAASTKVKELPASEKDRSM
jgi:carbon storage regulator